MLSPLRKCASNELALHCVSGEVDVQRVLVCQLDCRCVLVAAFLSLHAQIPFAGAYVVAFNYVAQDVVLGPARLSTLPEARPAYRGED